MRPAKKAFIGVAAIMLCLFGLGFILFATFIMRDASGATPAADGIVVLTGGDLRIREGARLLRQGNGARLLITGVNRRTGRKDLLRLSGLPSQKFDCCVDIGYRALDTVGNADETKAWARERGFKSLIVVTSSYHMPRGLAELSLEMPGVALFPHPVKPRSFQTRAWWLDPVIARVLAAEYLKYLPAALRLAVAVAARPWDSGSVARAEENRRADAADFKRP